MSGNEDAEGGVRRRRFLKGAALSTVGLGLGVAGVAGRAATRRKDVLDVAVIGAGISGLTAARDLRRAGLENIAVLEARSRVGGRTYTQTLGTSGLHTDAGATWIGPGQTAVQNLLRELGIGTIRNYYKGDLMIFAGGQATRDPSASPISNEGFIERINALARTVPIDEPWSAERAAQYDAMTYADYLATQSLSDEDRFGIELGCQLTFGAKPEYLSFLFVLFYTHSAGGYDLLESLEGGAQQDRIVGGTQAISNKLAEQLRSIVRLDQAVKSIGAWNGSVDDVVRVETGTGSIEARMVILALSPSQAHEIHFAPTLPKERMDLMSHWPRGGHMIKIGVAFETPFWRAKGLSGQVFSPDGPFLWGMDVSPADGSSGQLMSFTMSTDTPPKMSEERKARIIDTYALCFGPEARNPIAYQEYDWSQDQFTRGCVSPLGPGILTRFGQHLRPANGRLVWAGTETSPIWMGYMDGAVRAGQRAALETLRKLANLT